MFHNQGLLTQQKQVCLANRDPCWHQVVKLYTSSERRQVLLTTENSVAQSKSTIRLVHYCASAGQAVQLPADNRKNGPLNRFSIYKNMAKEPDAFCELQSDKQPLNIAPIRKLCTYQLGLKSRAY